MEDDEDGDEEDEEEEEEEEARQMIPQHVIWFEWRFHNPQLELSPKPYSNWFDTSH